MGQGRLFRVAPVALGLLVSFLPAPGRAATPAQRSPFPITFPNVGWARTSRPLLANMGFGPGASDKAIVFGTSGFLPGGNPPPPPTTGGWLYAIRPDGQVATGFPKSFPAEVNTPAALDVDGDGKADLFVGYKSTFNGSGGANGGVRAYLSSGGYADVAVGGGTWNRPSRTTSPCLVCGGGVYSTPVVADLDGDGKFWVAWGGYDGWLYVVDALTGADKPGWPIFIKDTVWASPAVFDLNGDGKKEIIFGVDSHGGGEIVLGKSTPFGGCIWAFKPDGSIQPGFPSCVSQVIWSSPAVGDINGDGKPEIVFGTGQYTSDFANPNFSQYVMTHKLFAITRDGVPAPGWPVSLEADEEVGSSPAIGDVDGDGNLEVVATTFRTTPANSVRSQLYVFKGDGTLVNKQGIYSAVLNHSSDQGGDPIIADVAGDGRPEILVPYGWEVAVFGYETPSSSTITQLTSKDTFDYSLWGPVGSLAVGNIDSTAEVELAILSSGHTGVMDVNEVAVNVWSPKVAASVPWGLFHQDAARTGVVPGTPVPPPPISPIVSSVSPSSGPKAGGTAVTITGANFLSGATVSFGTAPATGVGFVSSAGLTATTPANLAGAVDVKVTNPDTRSGVLTSGFTYISTPAISSVSPSTGPTTGGTTVSILGADFVNGASVFFGGTAARSVTFGAGNFLSAVTPAHREGSVDVLVVNPDARSGTLPSGFTFIVPASRFFTVSPPCRAIDTRNPAGNLGGPALVAGQSRTFTVGGVQTCGAAIVPLDASALSINLTVADSSAPGSLTLYPGGAVSPPDPVLTTNSITFVPGKNRANNSTMGLLDGSFTVRNLQLTGTVNMIVDVNGYYR
jgi:hypothetical protein